MQKALGALGIGGRIATGGMDTAFLKLADTQG
jgi:hypothetical protein